MGENYKLYLPTHPGHVGAKKIKDYCVPVEDYVGAFQPAFLMGNLFGKNMAPIIGGGIVPDVGSLVVGGWTVVTGGTNDAIAHGTAGGLLLTLASDDNFDMTLSSVLAFTPVVDKWYTMAARIAVSDADGVGFKLGLTTGGGAAALPFGTNYTDVVGFSKPIESANMVGTARGNSGTAADTGTLATLADGVEIEVSLSFKLHATEPEGFFVVNGVVTPFTAAQLAQLIAILTTPPTMYWTIHGTGKTSTNPTISVISFIAGGDK